MREFDRRCSLPDKYEQDKDPDCGLPRVEATGECGRIDYKEKFQDEALVHGSNMIKKPKEEQLFAMAKQLSGSDGSMESKDFQAFRSDGGTGLAGLLSGMSIAAADDWWVEMAAQAKDSVNLSGLPSLSQHAESCPSCCSVCWPSDAAIV